ncbi:hypothetical protein FKF78_07770 [Aeromonas hydrophila]|nr:hypothetical protein C1A23_17215 [Aeromonas hydrophila subsp. hydrophila]MBX9565780.1 hypothetical protein [Aeromonas hydrophila]
MAPRKVDENDRPAMPSSRPPNYPLIKGISRLPSKCSSVPNEDLLPARKKHPLRQLTPIDNGIGGGMMRSHFDSPHGITHDHLHPASAVVALRPAAAHAGHRGVEHPGATLAGP